MPRGGSGGHGNMRKYWSVKDVPEQVWIEGTDPWTAGPMRECSRCGIEKPVRAGFHVDNSRCGKDGRKTVCIRCEILLRLSREDKKTDPLNWWEAYPSYIWPRKELNQARDGKKICSRCDTEKPVDSFGKNNQSKDGYTCWCRPCIGTYRKQWREGMSTKPQCHLCNQKEKKDRLQEVGEDLRCIDCCQLVGWIEVTVSPANEFAFIIVHHGEGKQTKIQNRQGSEVIRCNTCGRPVRVAGLARDTEGKARCIPCVDKFRLIKPTGEQLADYGFNKECDKCGKTFPYGSFPFDGRTQDGMSKKCDQCSVGRDWSEAGLSQHLQQVLGDLD